MTAFLSAVLQRRVQARPSITEVEHLFAELKASIGIEGAAEHASAVSRASSECPAPFSPRGAIGVAELDPSLKDEHRALVGACCIPVDAPACCPWAPFPRSGMIGQLSGRHLAGIVALSRHLLIAPRQTLRAERLLHLLELGGVVLCGVELPARINDPRTTVLSFDAPFTDIAAATVAAGQLLEREAASQRNTILVGEEARTLAAALLQVREGLTEFEASLRVREACPIGQEDSRTQ